MAQMTARARWYLGIAAARHLLTAGGSLIVHSLTLPNGAPE